MNPELAKTLKRLAWVAGLFLTLVLVIAAMERRSGSPVNQLDVIINPLPGGYRLIDSAYVRTLIYNSFGYHLEGQSQNLINIDRLERVMEEDEFVLDAEVHINVQDEVEIEIWQREPVLRIMDDNGLNYYLDKSGSRLSLSPHFTPRVLVVTGELPPFSEDFLEKEDHVLKDLFDLAKMIRDNDFYYSLIEQIHVTPSGFTLIPKIGSQKIRFGYFENEAHAADKLKRLKVFYKEGLPYEGFNKYKIIDLRFEGQVVAKKK